MDSKKKTVIIVLAVVAVILAGVFIFIGSMGKALDESSTSAVSITVASGMGTAQIAESLEEQSVIDSADKFRLWSRLKGFDSKYKAGTYSLSPSMDYEAIAEILVGGKVDTVSFTIPEGYTIYQTAKSLSEQGLGEEKKFTEILEGKYFDEKYTFLKDAQDNKNHLEGYVFPNTYTVDKSMSEEQIIDVMLNQFDKDLYAMYTSAKESGNEYAARYSLNEILTIASIIERECGVDNERPMVASVIYNRLNSDMALQMCSTVQYVLGKQKAVLSIADTQIESPYNTYLNAGLPPGPICSPGKASFEAALNPDDTDYLYFVLSEKLDGTSNFSKDYDKFLKDKVAYDKAYTEAHS